MATAEISSLVTPLSVPARPTRPTADQQPYFDQISTSRTSQFNSTFLPLASRLLNAFPLMFSFQRTIPKSSNPTLSALFFKKNSLSRFFFSGYRLHEPTSPVEFYTPLHETKKLLQSREGRWFRGYVSSSNRTIAC